MAYQTRNVVGVMTAETGQPLRELRVDGGAAANGFLMQFQADIGKPTPNCGNHGFGWGLSGGFGGGILVLPQRGSKKNRKAFSTAHQKRLAGGALAGVEASR